MSTKRQPRKSNTGNSVVTFLIIKNMEPQIEVAKISPKLGRSVPADLRGVGNIYGCFRGGKDGILTCYLCGPQMKSVA